MLNTVISTESRLALDPTYHEIDSASFNKYNLVDFNSNVKEEIIPSMLESRGKDVDLRMYIDSNHSGDKSIRISKTGFLIYMNMDLIQWVSNKQLTIEM